MWFECHLFVIKTLSQSILSSHLPISGICCLILLLPQPAAGCPASQLDSTPGSLWTLLVEGVPADVDPFPRARVLGGSLMQGSTLTFSSRGQKTQDLGRRGATGFPSPGCVADLTQAGQPEVPADSCSKPFLAAAEPQQQGA